MADLQKQEIYCGVHYRDNIEYSMYQYAEGTCPKARYASDHILTLPLHMWLTDENVENIIAGVLESINNYKFGDADDAYLTNYNNKSPF